MLNIRDDACLLFDRTIAGEGVCGWCWVTGLKSLVSFRLWHQLTLQVLDFVQDPCFAQGDGLIKLYENFISEFEHRVNPLSLVEIILHVVGQMTDPNVALSFLEKTHENSSPTNSKGYPLDRKHEKGV